MFGNFVIGDAEFASIPNVLVDNNGEEIIIFAAGQIGQGDDGATI